LRGSQGRVEWCVENGKWKGVGARNTYGNGDAEKVYECGIEELCIKLC